MGVRTLLISDLDAFLHEITSSEKLHIKNGPEKLSQRYDKISKIKINNEDVYNFSYQKFLGSRTIGIVKETRWASIPKHIHEVVEIIYVYSGDSVQYVNGQKVALHEGDLCILDESVMHSINYLNENDIVISIALRKDYLFNTLISNIAKESIISEFLANALSKETIHNKFLIFKNISHDSRQIITRILSEYFKKTICSDQIINACMILLMSNLIRQYRSIKKKSMHKSSISTDELLIYIESNFQTVTLKKMAKHYSFNSSYLSNLIKKETGFSFKELVTKEKFYHAATLLRNTSLPVYKVAELVGYNNLGFFYKKFRSKFNVNPDAYRKKNQE